MKIYMSASWKHEHAVVMLTKLLRDEGHVVLSYIENDNGELHGEKASGEEWFNSPEAQQSFEFDTQGATKSDLVIYLGASGHDAWAEVGAAWGAGVPIIALYSKGEQIGLMRKMATWCVSIDELLGVVDRMKQAREACNE